MTQSEYDSAKRILLEYLYLRISQDDWHGVWDVAIDLAILKGRLEESKRG